MQLKEKQSLVERYINGYNAFDVDTMMSVIHPDIEFKNVANGEVNVTAYGKEEFLQLASQSQSIFSSRKQVIKDIRFEEGVIALDISYEGVLVSDLPNGMKAGETLTLSSRSEFSFRDGKIAKLIDIC